MYVPKDTILDVSPITDPTPAQSLILSYQNLKFLCVQGILLPILLTYTNHTHKFYNVYLTLPVLY